MQAVELVELVKNSADDLKAQNISVLDVQDLTTMTDYMVIASGGSGRQVNAIASRIVEDAKSKGIRPIGVEGEKQGEWVLVDFGDVIVHVMHPSTRDFYQLEKLWSGTDDVESPEE